MFTDQDVGPKEKKSDRILVLKPIEGTKAKSSTGLDDPRLFNGGNNLHGIKDQQTNLWYFKYESGVIPEPLKQRFTSFPLLKKHAEDYYVKRNIAVVEVLD